MNSNIVFAVFAGNNTSVIASHAWQYDYGQILRIQGLHLPAAVEVHFAIEDEETSTTRVGVTTNDITDVVIRAELHWHLTSWKNCVRVWQTDLSLRASITECLTETISIFVKAGLYCLRMIHGGVSIERGRNAKRMN